MTKQKPYDLVVYSTRCTEFIYHKGWECAPEQGTEEDRLKLLFGALLPLRRTAEKMSPRDQIGQLCGYTTSSYKMHFYMAPSGYMFVLITSRDTKNLRESLANFFQKVFIPTVVFNPLYELDTKINLPAFDRAVESFNFFQ